MDILSKIKNRWTVLTVKVLTGMACGIALFMSIPDIIDKFNKPLVSVDTASQIEEIRSIKILEVARYECEELYEYKREGKIIDDELIKIYYGKLMLGIDFGKIKDDCLKKDGTTAHITLPDIELLNRGKVLDFSRTFDQSGWVDNKLRQEAAKAAEEYIITKYITPETKEKARQAAVVYVDNLLKGLGYTDVVVEFIHKS